jgi:hypothetical protein
MQHLQTLVGTNDTTQDSMRLVQDLRKVLIDVDSIVPRPGGPLGSAIVLMCMTGVMRKASAASGLCKQLEHFCRLFSIRGTIRIVRQEIVALDALCLMRLRKPGSDVLTRLAIFKLNQIEKEQQEGVRKAMGTSDDGTFHLPVRN